MAVELVRDGDELDTEFLRAEGVLKADSYVHHSSRTAAKRSE